MSEQDSKKNHYSILKVTCTCKGCEKKIKKSLLKIQGVKSLNIDAEEGKVLVVGNVDPNELINTLQKSGKHAQISLTHKPLAQPSKQKSNSKSNNEGPSKLLKKKSSSNSNNKGKEHEDTGNDNAIPNHHPHSKGNNGDKKIGHMVLIDPRMNNGGGYHDTQMMQMQSSYGQQRFMPMPMMNRRNVHTNMIPQMHGMPHPSMMHRMPHPYMMHGMQHSTMMRGMLYPPMNYMAPPRRR